MVDRNLRPRTLLRRGVPTPTAIAIAIAIAVTGLLQVASVASSQELEGHHGIFSETIDVTLVNLEVMAFDASGKAVTDLTRDELLVFEDGEPVEINYFTAAQPATAETFEVDAFLEPSEPPADADPVGPAERKHAIILIDNDHLSAAGRNTLLRRMRDELRRFMDDDTWVMVVEKSGSVSIECHFTNDRSLVDSVLTRLEEGAPSGGMTIAEERRLRLAIETASLDPEFAAAEASLLLSNIHLFARSLAQRVHHTWEVLNYLVDSLSGVPGRKALFYVAVSPPVSPGKLLFRQWWGKYGRLFGERVEMISPEDTAQEYDTSEGMLGVIANAAASRVAFYPVDTGQDVGSRAVSAAYTSVDATERILSSGGADEVAMGLLAQATGGRSARDTVFLDELLTQAKVDLETFYTLGFVSRFRGDGKVHKVKVKTTRPGVKLRYFNRYRSKTDDQQLTDRTLAALLLDEASNPLEVRIDLGDPVPVESGKKRDRKKAPKSYVVPVVVRLPTANLSLMPEEAAHVGSLSLLLVLRDSAGVPAPPIKIEIPVKIPHQKLASAMNQLVGYKTKIEMRSGEQKIAIAVRDDVSRIVSTLNLNVDLGDT